MIDIACQQQDTLILGIGNPLMADDGAGVRVVELLRQEQLPVGVTVQDGGTAGIGLVPEMQDYRRVILVDCAEMGLEPGAWKRFGSHEVNLLSQDESPLSLHHAGFTDAVRLADALGILPEVVIIYGIQPASVKWDHPMSAPVKKVLPLIVRTIKEEVAGRA